MPCSFPPYQLTWFLKHTVVWAKLANFLVKNWVVLARWPWLLELITKLTLWIINPLNSVQWYPMRLTPLGNVEAALSCRLTTCPVEMADVFIFKSSKKAQWNKKKVGRTSPHKILTLVPGALWKIKQLIFLWLKENAIKSLVPNCYSRLARAIPKPACRGIFNDFQWKLGLKNATLLRVDQGELQGAHCMFLCAHTWLRIILNRVC